VIDTIIFTMHVLLWPLCVVIVGLILLQGGAGDISSAFGGGGQLDSTLGVGAGRKMAKLTGWLSAIFMGGVLFLAIPHHGSLSSPKAKDRLPTPAPAAGAVPAAGPATMSPAPSAPEIAIESAASATQAEVAPVVGATTAAIAPGSASAPALESPAAASATAAQGK
jgi:protein translocase SecG subunit